MEGTYTRDPGEKCANLLRTKIQTYPSQAECETVMQPEGPLAYCELRSYDKRFTNYDNPDAQVARQPQPLIQCPQGNNTPCWDAMGFTTPPNQLTTLFRTVGGIKVPSCDIPTENGYICNFYGWRTGGLTCEGPAPQPCAAGFALNPTSNPHTSECQKFPFYHGIHVIEKTIQGSVRVVVTSVDPGSPADGKISVDDIITTVNTEYMYTTSQFINRMDSAPLADKTMEVYRNGQNITVSVLPTVQ